MGARPRRASAGPGDARDGRGHRAEIAGDVAFDDGNERGVIVGEGDAPAWQQRGGGEAGDPEACARFGGLGVGGWGVLITPTVPFNVLKQASWYEYHPSTPSLERQGRTRGHSYQRD